MGLRNTEPEARLCPKCLETKPITEFTFKNRATGVRQWQCRACDALYKRDWYARNRDSLVAYARINRDRRASENHERAWAYLREHPCVDCGETDPVVLEFDHLQEKRRDIAYMLAKAYSWATIEAEIAKCEVRCANCHRRKTAHERGILDRKRGNQLLEETRRANGAAWSIIGNAGAVSSVDRASAF